MEKTGSRYLFSKSERIRIQACNESENPNLAWYYKLSKCVTQLNEQVSVSTISKWPQRLRKPPSRNNLMESEICFIEADDQMWARRVAMYKNSLNVRLGTPSIRNIMDMNSQFGGFAAALVSDPVWVMNVIPSTGNLTLDIIYDRGFIGVYHDWCEPFSTYPRTYDLIHASDLLSLIKDPSSGNTRCDLINVMVEIDRILRPEGIFILHDSPESIRKIE